jgi:putative ABC transport system permease protein
MLVSDIRNAWRSVLRSPAATSAIVLTLALGVGANTAVLTLVHAVLWRQLPFQNPQQLVSIWSHRSDRDKAPLSIADFQDFRGNGALADAAAFAVWGATLTGEREPERLQGVRSTANVFALLGAGAAVGRALEPADDSPGRPRVVVLSYGFWQRRFGGDPAIVGRSLSLNGDSYEVAGVLPPGFFFPMSTVDFVVPLSPATDPRRLDRGDHFLWSMGRLRAGETPRRAEEQLTALASRLQRTYPATNSKNTGVRVFGLQEELIGNFRQDLVVLAAAAGVLLLMACSSLANLSLTLANGRRYELAIRASLGADRADLVLQLLIESVVRAVLGALAAIAFAYGGVQLLTALTPAGMPRLSEVRIDGWSLALNLVLAIAAGVVVGLLPAVAASRPEWISDLRSVSRGATESSSHLRARSLLSAAQLALSVMLLVAAGLLLKSFLRLQTLNPGFDSNGVLVTRLALMPVPFPTVDSVALFQAELRRRIEQLPGVQDAGAVNILPMSGVMMRADFVVDGHPPASPEDTPSANYRVAGPGYFAAMKTAVLAGRDFAESDDRRGRNVAIVSRSLARRYFGDRSPAGTHMRISGFGSGEVEIVGVVADTKQVGLADEAGMDLYLPYAQAPNGALPFLRNNMFWTVRSSGNPMNLAAAVRRSVYGMNRDVAVASALELNQYLGTSVASRRFNLILLAAFALSAMLLAVVAVYGVVSYTAARRTREIGLRMALGAQRHDVLALIAGQGLRLTIAGIAAGLLGTLAATRLIAGVLYHTRPLDPIVIGIVCTALAASGLLASYLPARRALRLDPLAALRQE